MQMAANAHYRGSTGPSHAAAPAASTSSTENDSDLLAYANTCRSNSNSSQSQSPPLSSGLPSRSQSQSPKFNIADFESSVQFPRGAHTTAGTRETSYASQANIDDLDFQRSSGENTPVPTSNRFGNTARNLNTSFLKRSASKLLPRAIATANIPTPPHSQPNSGANSPTKSLASFISGNTTTTNSTISTVNSLSSSASRASVRAKTASKVLFDNYFNGDSNNVLSPYGSSGSLSREHSHCHSRSGSVASAAPARRSSEDDYGYEQDDEVMASTQTFTRQPARTRPRRSPTAESTASTPTSYAGKLGSWFSKTASPKSAAPQSPIYASAAMEDDPLLHLDMHAALFPYGPVDPLNPTSFNDLLAAAEATIATYQNAYRQRVAELASVKAEMALKEEEVEECETRASCLKAQLRDMSEQVAAQTERAESLEAMVREVEVQRPVFEESCETLVEEGPGRRGQTAASDSGFESDGDSVLSRRNSPVKDRAAATAAIISRPPVMGNVAMHSPSRPQYSNDLRVENEMLRQRVLELEGAVDSCLDMISNPLAL